MIIPHSPVIISSLSYYFPTSPHSITILQLTYLTQRIISNIQADVINNDERIDYTLLNLENRII